MIMKIEGTGMILSQTMISNRIVSKLKKKNVEEGLRLSGLVKNKNIEKSNHH